MGHQALAAGETLFLVQLCCYADLLARVTGDRPPFIHVVLGDGQQVRFAASEYFDYYRNLRQRFLAEMESFDLSHPPDPEPGRDHGRWTSHAEHILSAKRSLALVADIRTSQIRRLETVGIRTVEDLAKTKEPPRGLKMKEMIFNRLHQQAALQIRTEANQGTPVYSVLDPDECVPGKGLCELPPADPGDVFFDLEGFPLMDDGLEYLFGASYRDGKGELAFRDWWAHDRQGERAAFESCVDWLYQRWQRHPQMHIYHYAAYEVSALKRLMCRFGSREKEVDEFLRHGVFIDLYTVIRHGLRVGTPSYSIKDIERLYRPKREGAVSTSMGSVVEYARWMESGEPEDWRQSPTLKAIRDYNRDDCDSTAELADWLRRAQKKADIAHTPEPSEPEEEKSAEKLASIREKEEETREVTALLEKRAAEATAPDDLMFQTAADLWDFYRRQAKPIFWQMFERADATPEEQWDDPCCLQGATLKDSRGEVVKRSVVFTYRFDPAQECKIRSGQNVRFAQPLSRPIPVHEIDLKKGRIQIKLGTATLDKAFPDGLPPQGTFLLDEVVAAGAKEQGLKEGPRHPGEGRKGVRPRHQPSPPHPSPRTGRAKRRAGSAYARPCGPPGNGRRNPLPPRTSGHRKDLHRGAARLGHPRPGRPRGHHRPQPRCDPQFSRGTRRPARRGPPGGQVWRRHQTPGLSKVQRSRPNGSNPERHPSAQRLDGLRGHLLEFREGSMVRPARCALHRRSRPASPGRCSGRGSVRPQPRPPRRPAPARTTQSGRPSRTERLVRARIPTRRTPDHPPRGGDLPARTRRLRPEICSVVSDLFYEGRLRSHPSAKKFGLQGPKSIQNDLPLQGVQFVPITHEGNTQSSDEEAEAIGNLAHKLLDEVKVAHTGSALEPGDILIIAPYNLQVRNLESRLPDFRVGTVDKFQGQEAEIVILSLCSSAGEYGTRGLDFLLNPRRLNVALSRARCLAVIVGDPRIVETPPTNTNLMRQLSAMARITSEARKSSGSRGVLGGFDLFSTSVSKLKLPAAIPNFIRASPKTRFYQMA